MYTCFILKCRVFGFNNKEMRKNKVEYQSILCGESNEGFKLGGS